MTPAQNGRVRRQWRKPRRQLASRARALASSDGGGADSSEVAAASPRRPRRSDAMFYSLLVEVQVSGTANDMAAPLTRSYDGQKHSLPLNPSESPGSVNVPAVVAHAVCCRLVM